MKIGDRIKQKRKELGLSVDEIAEKLGKNRATIYRYENEDIENLPVNILEPLAKALRTTPAYLMGWDESAMSKPSSSVLGMHLSSARTDKGYSLGIVTQMTGISDAALSSWEQNISSPAPEELAALAKLYEVSTDWLVGNTSVRRPIGTVAAHMIDPQYQFTEEEEEEIRSFIEFIKTKSQKNK